MIADIWGLFAIFQTSEWPGLYSIPKMINAWFTCLKLYKLRLLMCHARHYIDIVTSGFAIKVLECARGFVSDEHLMRINAATSHIGFEVGNICHCIYICKSVRELLKIKCIITMLSTTMVSRPCRILSPYIASIASLFHRILIPESIAWVYTAAFTPDMRADETKMIMRRYRRWDEIFIFDVSDSGLIMYNEITNYRRNASTRGRSLLLGSVAAWIRRADRGLLSRRR